MSEQALVETAASQPAKSRSLGANIFLNGARTVEFRVGAAIFIGVILLSVVAPSLLGLSATLTFASSGCNKTSFPSPPL